MNTKWINELTNNEFRVHQKKETLNVNFNFNPILAQIKIYNQSFQKPENEMERVKKQQENEEKKMRK